MMGPSFKTTAILLLLAGASMGVFAGSLTAGEKPSVQPSLNDRIESQVREYTEFYGLDEVQTDRVRMILRDFQRQLRDELMKLYSENRQGFESLQNRAEQRIQDVVGKNAKVK